MFPGLRGENGAVAVIAWHLESAERVAIFLVILTRRFALELGQHGITVNAVAPGFVRTELTQRGRGAADWPGTEERFAAR